MADAFETLVRVGGRFDTGLWQKAFEAVKLLSPVCITLVLTRESVPNATVVVVFLVLAAVFALDYLSDRHRVRSRSDERVKQFETVLDSVAYDRLDDETERVRAYLELLSSHLTDPDNDIRFTYHTPVDGQLEQMFPYIPDGGGEAGRRFDTDQGIIGEGYARGRELAFNCRDTEGCVDALRLQFGYDRGQAEYHSSQRGKRSYFCYPLIDEATDETVGIVYFESTEYETFPQRDDDELQLVEAADRDETLRKVVATCERIASEVV